METKGFEHSVIFDLAKQIEYSSNGIVSKRILERKTGNITLFSFDKDQKLSEHKAPFDVLVQVIEGTGEISIAGQSHILHPRESIIMPANIMHAVYAVERFKMILTMIKE